MPRSTPSSSAFAHCPPDASAIRLEWRPSPVLCVALAMLGILGALSVLACEMPRWCALPLAGVSTIGGAWLARGHARRRPHALVWPLEGELMVDGRHVRSALLHWRGPLAFLRWLALPLALLSAIRGPWLARRYLRAPVRAIAWPMDGNPTIDGARMEGVRLHWRGPLAFLRYRDAAGRDHRLAWWPDTLQGGQRRELRLAAASAPTPVAVASMAP